MRISDVITLLSLIIALVAIISEKKRKHLILKFSNRDFGIYIIAFLLINYFVFYHQFYSGGYYFDFLYFNDFGLNNPIYYSYIISLALLITMFSKIWYSFYPKGKRELVIKYYKGLIETNEIFMLLDLIERYHSKDIVDGINTSEDYSSKPPQYFTFEELQKKPLKTQLHEGIKNIWGKIYNHSKYNRQEYALLVLYNIVNTPAFIALSASNRPYFFANLFSNFKMAKRDSFPRDLVNLYLNELIKSKNFWLIKELKESDGYDNGLPKDFFPENRIIGSLIQDVSVAHANEIWRPFGERAIKEIESENSLGNNSRLYQKHRDSELVWEYEMYISIKFFNILVIESIVKKYTESHFFLHYYWHFTDKILINFQSSPPPNFEEQDSFYHRFIIAMNENILNWLDLANKYETDRYYDIIGCLGFQLRDLIRSPFWGENRKIELIENILDFYCNVETKSQTDNIRTELEKILLNPDLTREGSPYCKYVGEAWTNFDKVPHYAYGLKTEMEYFTRLKNNVITPLGLDPNES